jgi:outer membrane protein TolC
MAAPVGRWITMGLLGLAGCHQNPFQPSSHAWYGSPVSPTTLASAPLRTDASWSASTNGSPDSYAQSQLAAQTQLADPTQLAAQEAVLPTIPSPVATTDGKSAGMSAGIPTSMPIGLASTERNRPLTPTAESWASASDALATPTRLAENLSFVPQVDAAQRPAAGRQIPASLTSNMRETDSPTFAPDGFAPTAPAITQANAPVAGFEDSATWVLDLGTVLQLADGQNPNVAFARERIREAYARVDRAQRMWLPSLRTGMNYNYHDGAIQDVAGTVFETSRSSLYGGLGAGAVGAGSPAVPGVVAQFHFADAISQPRIASHQAASRRFNATAARNDVLRDAAVAYWELVRAEHGLAISQDVFRQTEDLLNLTRESATAGQGLQSDYQRMAVEAIIRRDELLSAQEAIQVASARLAQLLHADSGLLLSSGEPLLLPLELTSEQSAPAELVATGLMRRPELAEQRHLVSEAVERLRREKMAPLVPSVLLGMSYGGLGGGLGGSIVNTNDRWDADAMAFWELRNLGFGERAARNEQASAVRQNQLRRLALLDLVAREVTESHAQVLQRKQRIANAQTAIDAAERSYSLNRERIVQAQGLPIEALQAVSALGAARRTYLNAVVDYNVAQIQLCRATGWYSDLQLLAE